MCICFSLQMYNMLLVVDANSRYRTKECTMNYKKKKPHINFGEIIMFLTIRLILCGNYWIIIACHYNLVMFLSEYNCHF